MVDSWPCFDLKIVFFIRQKNHRAFTMSFDQDPHVNCLLNIAYARCYIFVGEEVKGYVGYLNIAVFTKRSS